MHLFKPLSVLRYALFAAAFSLLAISARAQCPQIQFVSEIDCHLNVDVNIDCGGGTETYSGMVKAGGWGIPTLSTLPLTSAPVVAGCTDLITMICDPNSPCTISIVINGVQYQLGDQYCCNFPFDCTTNNCSYISFDCTSGPNPTFMFSKPPGCP